VNQEVLQQQARLRRSSAADEDGRFVVHAVDVPELQPLDGVVVVFDAEPLVLAQPVDHDARPLHPVVAVDAVRRERDGVVRVRRRAGEEDLGRRGEHAVFVGNPDLGAVVRHEARRHVGEGRAVAGPSVDAVLPGREGRELAGDGVGLARATRPGEDRSEPQLRVRADREDRVVRAVDRDPVPSAAVDGGVRPVRAGARDQPGPVGGFHGPGRVEVIALGADRAQLAGADLRAEADEAVGHGQVLGADPGRRARYVLHPHFVDPAVPVLQRGVRASADPELGGPGL
jgi:hypothetical protein